MWRRASVSDNLQSVYARNCEVRRVDKATAAAFLSQHHRLGNTVCRYRYGLFVTRRTGASEAVFEPGTLVAVASFSSPRHRETEGLRESSYEWVRYASLTGLRVVGGMGKMLEAFIADRHPDDVMTYADADTGDAGSVYLKLGFKCECLVERPGFRSWKFRLTITGRSCGAGL